MEISSTGQDGKCPSQSSATKPGMAMSSTPWVERDRARNRCTASVPADEAGHVVDVLATRRHPEAARQRVVHEARHRLELQARGIGPAAHLHRLDQLAVAVGATRQQAEDVL